jgi:hypothetical protein
MTSIENMKPLLGFIAGSLLVVAAYLICGVNIWPGSDHAFTCYVLAVMVGVNGALLNL